MGSKKAKPTIVNNTSTNAPPPEIMAQYNALIARANDVASTPYKAYAGDLSAGWNGDQQAATNALTRSLGTSASIDDTLRALSQSAGGVGSTFAGYAGQAGDIGQQFGGLAGQAGGTAGQAGLIGADIAANSNVYKPYYDDASSLTTQGATAYRPTDFSSSEMAKYMSPYTTSVIDTTLANVNQNNALQQKTVLSDAIKSGNAFGGDRAGLAQAELVRNQNLSRDQIIAGLTNQNYSQALGQFNTQQAIGLSADQNNAARALQAGAQMGQLGTGAQTAALSGRTAQLAALAAQLASIETGGRLTGQQLEALKTSGAMSAQELAALAQQGQTEGQRVTNNNSQGALAQQQLAAGTLRQQTDQQALDRLYQQYANETSFPYQQTGWLGNLVLGLGSNSGGTTTGQSTQTGGQGTNSTGQIIGGALSLAAALPWSDERVKEDVKRIGETYDGQPMYSFRYKGDPITHVGLMAQEVEKQTPDAVVEMDGIKRVDYAAATKDASERGRFAYGGSIPGQNVTSLIPELNMQVGRTMPNATAPGISAPQQAPDNSKQFQDLGKSAGDLLKKSGIFNSPLSLTGDTAASAIGSAVTPLLPGSAGGFGQVYAFGGAVEEQPRLPSFADPTVVSPDVLAALRAEREAAKAAPVPGLGFEPVKATPIGGLGAAMMTGEPATGLGSAALNDNAALRPAASGLAGPMPSPTADVAYTGLNAGNRPSEPRPAGAGNSAFASLFERKAAEHGVSPRYLDRTANIETGGRYDPEARNPNSSASGLFQFLKGTARDYGLANPFDPEQATDAAARLARDNAAALRRALGRDPTDSELYLAHQQGAGGAAKILTNPNAPMESLVGEEAARLNGGAGLTAAQFAAKYGARFDGTASAFAPTQPSLAGSPGVRAINDGLRSPDAGLSAASMSPQPAAEDRGLFGTGFRLSEEARQGLLAAGLAMMASRSANLGQVIGEGGLAGLGTYQNAKSGLGKAAIEQAQLDNLRSTTRGRDAEVALKATELQQRMADAARVDGIFSATPAAKVTAAGTPAATVRTAPLAINPAPVAPSDPVAPSGGAPAPVEAVPAPAPLVASVAPAPAADAYPALDPQWDPAKLTAAAAAVARSDPDRAKSYRDRAAQIVKEGVALGPDGRTVALPDVKKDPVEKETKAVTLEKLKRELQGKQFKSLVTPEDRAAAGVEPDFKGPVQVDRDGQLHFPGKASTEVNLGQKAETTEASGRGKGLADRLNSIVEDGAKAGQDSVTYQRFGELLDAVKTGKMTETLEKVRQITGLALDANTDRVQALNAAIQHIAPSLRVPGSGAQSDRELGNFLASIPSLSGTPGGNKLILDGIAGLVNYRKQRADIATQWQLGDISAKQAQTKLDALPSPFAKKADDKKPDADATLGEKPKATALPDGYDQSKALDEARAAIASGKPRAAIVDRLNSFGIDTSGL